MKRLSLILVLIIVVVAVSGCNGNFFDSRKPISVAVEGVETVRVYVYGAVEREGFYDVEIGTLFFDVAMLAGVSDCSMVVDGNKTVTKLTTSITVRFVEDGNTFDPINVNGTLVKEGKTFSFLTQDIANVFHDYFQTHDKITNKAQLKEILGEKYEEWKYKLCVLRGDYEDTY